MNAATITVTRTPKGTRHGYVCTCRQRLSGLSEVEAQRQAEKHAKWHETRHETVTIDCGALAGRS